MAICKFDKPLTEDLAALLARARRELEARGGTFQGDLDAGHFTARTPLGAISGTYTVAADVLRIAVSQKPRLVLCAAIDAVVNQFLRGG